jgi:CHAT domain-containing protein
MKLVYFLLVTFSASLLYSASEDKVWLAYTAKDWNAIQEINNKIRSGYYDEAMSLIDAKIKPSSKNMLTALCYIKRATCRHLTLKKSLADKNIQEVVRLIDAFSSEEQQVIRLELVNYFCSTGELVRADSTFKKFVKIESKAFAYSAAFSEALIQSKKGDFKKVFFLLNAPEFDLKSLELNDKVRFNTLQQEREMLMAQTLLEFGRYEASDSILSSMNFGRFSDSWYMESQRANLRGKLFLTQKKYDQACVEFLKGMGQDNYSQHAFDYLINLYYLIECNYRRGNMLDANNYLRRLQQVALVSSGKQEMAEVAFESAFALSLIMKGEFSTADYRITRGLSWMNDAACHPFLYKLLDLKRELFLKTGQVKNLSQLQNELSFKSYLLQGENSIEHNRRKLQESVVNSTLNGQYFTSLASYRRYFDNGLSLQIHANSSERIPYLFAFADAFYNTDFADSAVAKLEQSLEISRTNYGPQSSQALYAEAKLCQGLMHSGEYKYSMSILWKLNNSSDAMKDASLAAQEKFYLLLAELNKVPGEFEISKKFLNKALSMQHKRLVPDFLMQAEAEEQYAFVYYETSNYYKSNRALERSLKLKRKYLSTDSPLLIQPLQQVALLKIATGDFPSADAALTPLGKITKASFGDESFRMAEYKLLLAEYLVSISDYKGALKEIEQADKIAKEKLGVQHLFRARILTDLAFVNDHIGATPASVKGKYESALELISFTIGIKTPLYMEVNKKYVTWLISQGSFDLASSKIVEIEKFWKEKGNEHVVLAELSGMKGDIARLTSNYEVAISQYKASSDMYKSLFNDVHPEYTRMLGKQARVLYIVGKQQEALAIMNQIIPVFLEFTKVHFPVLSFRQKALYWASIREEFEFYNNLAFESKLSSPELWGKAWDISLVTKGILLTSGTKLLNQIYSSQDTLLIASYNEWIASKEQLISTLSLSKAELQESGIDRGQLESKIEQLEKDMASRSAAFNKEKKNQSGIKWEDVQQILSADEVMVEFIRYRKFRNNFLDSSSYAALSLTKKSDKPQLVKYDNGIQMEKKYLKYYRNSAIGKMTDEYSYGMYWKALKATIDDGKRIYLSADGVYAQLNLEMMRFEDGTYSIDHNDIVYISTTRDLMNMVEEKKSKNKDKSVTSTYMICGNPTFYSSEFTGTHKNIASLPGTAKEIEVIKLRLDSAGKQSVLLSENNLKEDSLKNAKSPRVLHIATHGMFVETKQSNKDELANNPLLNSGILLAEAGDILDNKLNPYVNQKNGVLTAFEAMDMQLDNTDLVILSACETGRGEVEAGEGVYGLQRSFLMAGSKAVVVSLFKVNDEVTQKLMEAFYSNWLKSGDKEKAFSDAKKAIKQQYNDPIYWGAFIMVEGKPERKLLQVSER